MKTSDYNLCISDLMVGFLFIFIILLVKFMYDFQNRKDNLIQPARERTRLLKILKNEMEKEDITVQIDERQGILKLTNIHSFEEGVYELDRTDQQMFKKIRKILYKYTMCYSNLNYSNQSLLDHYKSSFSNLKNTKQHIKKREKDCFKYFSNKQGLIDSILIEGHADRTPIGNFLRWKGIETNLDLAMERSQSVFLYLTEYKEGSIENKESGGYLYTLKNNNDQPLFGLSSYGNLRKVTNRSPASNDRRVDIRFIMDYTISDKKEGNFNKMKEETQDGIK